MPSRTSGSTTSAGRWAIFKRVSPQQKTAGPLGIQRACAKTTFFITISAGFSWFARHRNVKSGPFARLRLDGNCASVFEDDLTGDKEANARAPAAFSGTEEPEGFARLYFIHAGPVVFYVEIDVGIVGAG